jgi:hypothetical protein
LAASFSGISEAEVTHLVMLKFAGRGKSTPAQLSTGFSKDTRWLTVDPLETFVSGGFEETRIGRGEHGRRIMGALSRIDVGPKRFRDPCSR